MKRLQVGQGLVEYALILQLVSLVVIIVLRILGPTIAALYCQMITDLLNVPDACAGIPF